MSFLSHLFTSPYTLKLPADALSSVSFSAWQPPLHTRVLVGESSLISVPQSFGKSSFHSGQTARSVTGQGLQILVHQHYGYRVHLEWRGSSSRVSLRCMERRFLMACEAERFCTELCSYGLGLCSCVYEGYYMSTHVRARCLRKPLMQSQQYLLKPTWWLKALQHVKRNSLCVSYFLFLYARMQEYIRRVHVSLYAVLFRVI